MRCGPLRGCGTALPEVGGTSTSRVNSRVNSQNEMFISSTHFRLQNMRVPMARLAVMVIMVLSVDASQLTGCALL